MGEPALHPQEREAWESFISSEENFIHMDRDTYMRDGLDSYVEAAYGATHAILKRVQHDTKEMPVTVMLDLGCSNGIKCVVAAEYYSDAKISGLEPEAQAVELGNAMVRARGLQENVELHVGVGEQMPFADNSFDLIVCHTVIEHVQNVEQVIAEVARVLKPGGVLHLEAPNYNWPHEPHIRTYCVPRFGKAFCRLCAKLQGNGKMAWYLEHLQFVHPRRLERAFRANGMEYENLYAQKIRNVASGKTIPDAYRFLGKVMRVCRAVKLDKLIAGMAIGLGLYPSVMYLVRKPSA